MSSETKFTALKSPEGEMRVPLNDVALPSPLMGPRVRRGTVGSEDFNDKAAKLRIDVSSDRKRYLKTQRLSPEFRFNSEMSLRVAVGVLIASAIQTRDSDYDPSVEHAKKWALFPSWYYLGGLSYCAVAVIFSAGKNVGGTVKQVCQAFYGVGMALVYNIVLFSVVDVKLYDGSYDGFFEVEKTFSSSPYWVNSHNFYTVLPWMILFTVAILLLPFENNTKKFALANNLYFTLTIINPADPLDSSALKSVGDSYFDTTNILQNLEMYFLVGFVGTLISLFVMFVPYPIFAIGLLRTETKQASEDILDLLNIIVDSYCFKNKNVDHMNFLKLKLHRKFEAASARHRRMLVLLDDAWWEQMSGFAVLLKFNRSIVKHYVNLVGLLLSDLRSLNHAMQLEKYDSLHFTYMKVLQREIYVIQVKSGELLNEISHEIHASTEKLDLQSIRSLETQMENTLHRYRSAQRRTLRTQKVSPKDVEGNVPLNLFLFSLNSFCGTMTAFQENHNKKTYHGGKRAVSFVKQSIYNFFFVNRYTRQYVLTAFKVAIAIIMGIFLAVYVYAFSYTTPAAVAYVMGNHIGGSFSVTVNRVGGVVAGSVVPSVFQFFISQICDPRYLNVALSSIALFIWVTISMYVSFSGGYGAYAGLVSAFISAGILLRQSDLCYAGGSDSSSSIAISSYSSLAQTSVGIILFILVELAMCPESATSLLRKNIQETLKLQQEAFEILFGHHLSSSDMMNDETIEKLRNILQVKVPALLVEQRALLTEASSEPLLWKPAFSIQKYESVLENSRRLLNNNNLLFKLVRWFNCRVEQNPSLKDAMDIRDSDSESARAPNGVLTTHAKWQIASDKFQSSVSDTFRTLQALFSDGFLYSDPDQTAIFMQMKEAFRMADKDCSGEIDADEVAVMLETIFAQSGAVKEEEIQKYVTEFMEIVDKDASGKVSFDEFMEALDNGLKLEVEVYHRRKPKAPVFGRQSSVAGRTSLSGALPRINEEGRGHSRTSATSSGIATMELPIAVTNATPRNSLDAHAPQVFKHSKSMLRKASTLMLSPMRREHDVLNVEDFTITDIAEQMKSAYVEWLMENHRYEKVVMEELLLLNCLVSGAEGIARNLTAMEEIVVST